MSSYSREIIGELVAGTLPWHQTKRIMSAYKDEDRLGNDTAPLSRSERQRYDATFAERKATIRRHFRRAKGNDTTPLSPSDLPVLSMLP